MSDKSTDTVPASTLAAPARDAAATVSAFVHPAVAVDANGEPALRVSDLKSGPVIADAHVEDNPDVRAAYAQAELEAERAAIDANKAK